MPKITRKNLRKNLQLIIESYLSFYFNGVAQQVNDSGGHNSHRSDLPHGIGGISHGQRKYRSAEQSHDHKTRHFIFFGRRRHQRLREHHRKYVGITESYQTYAYIYRRKAGACEQYAHACKHHEHADGKEQPWRDRTEDKCSEETPYCAEYKINT